MEVGGRLEAAEGGPFDACAVLCFDDAVAEETGWVGMACAVIWGLGGLFRSKL